MSNPEIPDHNDMYADPDTSTHSIVNPELLSLPPSPQTDLHLRISDRVRDGISVSCARLAGLGEHTSGSLREKIAEVAPYANDYDTEDRIDE